MGPVPWARVSPDVIEQVVAVLVNREHPAALRVKPSQGDGGLDIIVPVAGEDRYEDFQVKSFTGNLTASHKRQIEASLRKAIQTHLEPAPNVSLAAWHLTLPLNATREQMRWLRSLADRLAAPFPVGWRDLSFIEGLAAKYPEVIDYYISNGEGRVTSMVADLRSLASLPESDGEAIIEPLDVVDRLEATLSLLNGNDPHFKYDYEVTSEPPIAIQRPSLVASITKSSGRGFVTFHVYARYANATADRPVPLRFNIRESELTEQQREAVWAMLRYGAPVELPGSAVTDFHVDLPAGLGASGPGTHLLKIGPSVAASVGGGRVVWAILPAESGEPIATIVIEIEQWSQGPLGGIRVLGTDTTHLVHVDVRLDPPGQDASAMHLTLSTDDYTGKPVRQCLSAMRFLRHYETPNRIAFGSEYGAIGFSHAFDIPESATPMVPAEVLEYVEAIDVISANSGLLATVPDFAKVTYEEVATASAIARALRGELVQIRWPDVKVWLRLDEVEQVPRDVAAPFINETRVMVPIDGVEHWVGPIVTVLPSAELVPVEDADPRDDGRLPYACRPGQADLAFLTNRRPSPQEVVALLARKRDA